MATKKNTGLSDKEVERIRKALGESSNYQSQAFDKARETRREKGILAAIKTYTDVSKKERILATGRKTNRGDFFRGAGFETLGDIVEVLFDKKASKQEVEEAKKSLNVKDQKIKGGGGGFSLSTSKQLLKRFKVIEDSVSSIREDVSYIRERVSPKQIEAGKGKDRQSYQYDPMAPQGEQVRQYTATGKISALRAGKNAEKSVIMQAAMLGGKFALRQEETERKRKSTASLKKFVDPKEKSPFDDDLKNALSRDPITILRKEMNTNFEKVFKMLEEMSGSKSVLSDLVGLSKLAGQIWGVVKYLTPVGLAAIVTGAIFGGVKGGIEKNVDTGIDNLVKDVTKKKGSESDYYKAIDDALSSKSTTAEQKDYLAKKLQTSENLSPEEREIVKKYFATKGARESNANNIKQWNSLEEQLRGWLQKNFASADRETQKYAKNSYADYFDSIKSKDSAPPTLEQFIALAQQNGSPAPGGATPSTTTTAPEVPVAKQTEAAPPPSPPTTFAPDNMEEITVSSMRKPTTVGDTGFLSKPVKFVVSKIKDIIVKAAKLVGVDPAFMLAMGKQESGFDPNAVPYDKKTGKPLSSAKGLFQFTDSTWKEMLSRYSDQYPQLMNGPMDPMANSIAGGLFARDNASLLKKRGIPVTGTNLYAAHFLGPGGAAKLLSADPAAPAVDVVGKKVADANKQVFYDKKGNPVPVSKVIEFLYKKVGSTADKFAAELNNEMLPSPMMSPSTTGAVAPSSSTNGSVIDNGSKQVAAGKESATQPVAVIAPQTNNQTAVKSTPTNKLPDANARSSEGAFNRALAKDYSHPTAFTTVGTT